MSAEDDLVKRLGELARAREADARTHAPSAVSPEFLAAAIVAQQQTERHAATVASPRRKAPWVALVLPVAAALALAVGRPWQAPLEAEFGPFVASVSGHVEHERGAARTDSVTLEGVSGARQEVVVRPVSAIRAPMSAAVLVARGSTLERTEVGLEVSEAGVVRFEIDGERLQGASEVRVVLARTENLARAVERALAALPVSRADGLVVILPVTGRR